MFWYSRKNVTWSSKKETDHKNISDVSKQSQSKNPISILHRNHQHEDFHEPAQGYLLEQYCSGTSTIRRLCQFYYCVLFFIQAPTTPAREQPNQASQTRLLRVAPDNKRLRWTVSSITCQQVFDNGGNRIGTSSSRPPQDLGFGCQLTLLAISSLDWSY